MEIKDYYNSRAAATQRAKQVRNKLHSKRHWKVRVHENMGWHWCLILGGKDSQVTLKLYESVFKGRISYYCLIGDAGGFSCWLDRDHYKDPNRAVAEQLKKAHQYIHEMNIAVNVIEQLR